MREILFRGLAVGSEWFHGNLMVCGDECYITSLRDGLHGQKVDPSTVGQFTGLLAGIHDDQIKMAAEKKQDEDKRRKACLNEGYDNDCKTNCPPDCENYEEEDTTDV